MSNIFNNYDCMVLGSGVLASAIAINLIKSGFPVIMVAKESEMVLRRKLSFKDALLAGKKTIGNITASSINEDVYHYSKPEEAVHQKKLFEQIQLLQKDFAFPIISLMEFSLYKKNKVPKIIINALMDGDFKINIDMADLVISLNSDTIPGIDCHLFIESTVNENLGEFYWNNLPGKKTETEQCLDEIILLEAEVEGVFVSMVDPGDVIRENATVGAINNKEIKSPVSGKIIGIRHSGEIISKNDPLIEIDLNKESKKDSEFSLKYRYLSMAVLQSILFSIKNKNI